MTATALTLTWSASTGSPPINYQPQYRVAGASTWLPFQGLIQTTSVVITGLSPATKYEFDVIASNGAGTTPSGTVSGTTASNNPFPLPGSVSGSQNTGSGDPVLSGPQNGAANTGKDLAITGLVVSDAAAVSATLSVSCTNGVLAMNIGGTSVTGSGTASITLSDTFARCQTALGTLIYTAPSSPIVDTINVTLADQTNASNTLSIQVQVTAPSSGVAPNAPTNVVASAASPTTMQLDWVGSTVGSTPITYQPVVRVTGTTAFIANGSPVASLTATVTGLSPSTSYDFAVVAGNSVNTATSTIVTASTTTAQVAPTAPTGLQVIAVPSTSMNFMWSPSTGTASITYQPQWRPTPAAGTNPNFTPFGPAIPGTSVTITSLSPSTSYDLNVVAINSVGRTTSAAVTSSTGVTGIPTDVTGIQALPAQDMLNRFGVNTHFGNGLYAAYTTAQAITAIQSIGCTLVRDSDNG